MPKSAGRALIIVIIVISLGWLLFAKKAAAPTTTTTETVETSQELTESTLNSQYIPYSPEAVAAATGKRKLLFFYASWCPTCKVLNRDLLENERPLPEDLVIFKTDYDREVLLKQKYNITYQHTLVLIDDSGNEIKQWNGGGVEQILKQI
jgi:thiol:disulfide interchange protein